MFLIATSRSMRTAPDRPAPSAGADPAQHVLAPDPMRIALSQRFHRGVLLGNGYTLQWISGTVIAASLYAVMRGQAGSSPSKWLKALSIRLGGGGCMSRGTGGGYWSGKSAQSVLKHAILKRYIPVFGGTMGSVYDRVVYLDGFAGEGRYENREPGSAELIMQTAIGMQQHLRWTCVFVERDRDSAGRLKAVVEEYREQGADATMHQGAVDDVIDGVVVSARSWPLFLFLDPCGLGLPFDRLVGILNGPRASRYPPTEVLLNFSSRAAQRLTGGDPSDPIVERNQRAFDRAMGGPWWRDLLSGQDGDDRIAAEYARRLGAATAMSTVTVPVLKKPTHKKTVYYLIFATRSSTGLWEFGTALAKANEEWWAATEAEEEADGVLFTVASALKPDTSQLEADAVAEIKTNILRLQAAGPFKLGDKPREAFGSFYGLVGDPVVRRAIKELYAQGLTKCDGLGKIRNRVVEA